MFDSLRMNWLPQSVHVGCIIDQTLSAKPVYAAASVGVAVASVQISSTSLGSASVA